MRRDLIIGLICSILFHAALGLSGEINIGWFAKKKKVVKEEAPVVQLELPKLEPEPPENTAEGEGPSESTTIAPPSVADVPGVVSFDSFTQAVQPPPPPKAGITMTIPKSTGPVASGTMAQVFDLKNLDQAPVPRYRAQPVYPFDMKRQGVGADVLVEFICDSNGEVRDAHVIKTDNHAFDNAALEAIYKWKFRPGKKGGRAVNARMQQPFQFNISNE
jgi:protein TonB